MIKKQVILITTIIGLGLSFSNAGSFPAIGMSSELNDGNNCIINEDLSINCDKSNHAFTNNWNGGGAKSISSIFWSEDGIGILHNNQNSGSNMQGLLVDGFHICSGNTQNYMQGNSDWFATCPGNFETIGNYTYEELIAILKSKKPLYWWNATQYAGTFLTIIYDGFYFSVGINGYGHSQPHLNGNFVSKDLGFSNSLKYSGINWNNNNIRYKPNGRYKPNNDYVITNQQCLTIKQLMENMGSNYNTGLCYNNTTYFNGTSFEQITKDNIFTIFNDNYENYTNRLSIYRNNCTTPNTTQACQNAFSGEYKKFSIFNNAKNSNVDEKRLRNYCNLGLNYDQNATTCTTTGTIKEEYTPEERLDAIINAFSGIPTPGTGNGENNVFNSLCDENDPDCYTNQNIRDIFGSLEKIYKKITGLFKERNGVNGIIPDYILWITFITILFTVIFKK